MRISVVVAQIVLVAVGVVAAIYTGSAWSKAPPLVLAFVLTAGRLRRSRRRTGS
jgi:hypothetical protein